MEEEKGPVILAMKGLPFTGKSTCARRLAINLRWPLIDQDDVLSSIVSKLEGSEISSEDKDHLDYMSFEAVCEMALALLQMDLKVIIDSPLLSSLCQKRLLQLRDSAGARLIIVECIPKDKFVWRNWTEQRDTTLASIYPYKSLEWDDIRAMFEEFDGYLNEDLQDFSKLVIDTTADFADYDLFFAVNDLLSQPEAVNQLDLADWLSTKVSSLELEEEGEEQEQEEGKKRKNPPHPHFLLSSNGRRRGSVTGVICEKCLKPISGQCYGCNSCEISLHISCAESPEDVVILPQDDPPYLKAEASQYSFPQVDVCKTCRDENKEFSYDCDYCLFQSHIRCESLPTVLKHEGHNKNHPLVLRIHPVSSNFNFKCQACGDWGKHMVYSCNKCKFECHIKCALAPATIKNIYHRHPLSRTYVLPYDDWEEHYCNACETRRNPIYWIYYCTECNSFECHITCKTFSHSE